jgi:hypothetical protein
MTKDSFWFKHDSNAKDDPKCTLLIEQLGLEGFGIYWVLIEILREQPDYKYPLKLIPALSRKYNTTAEKMGTVVKGYDLFSIDENNFFSDSLLERMNDYDALKETRRNAALMRWESKSNAFALQKQCMTNANRVDKNRVDKNNKEILKKEKFGEFKNVFLSDEEYNQLIKRFGKTGTNDRIENLSGYLASKGDKYKSHYATILSWERNNNSKSNKSSIIERDYEDVTGKL